MTREAIQPVMPEASSPATPATVLRHGARILPAVMIDTYNEELRDAEGFVGDRASGRAFRAILDDWRDRLREHGIDPFGETPTRDISKGKLDKMLLGTDPVAAGLVHSAVEEFSVELATVVRRFLRLDGWKDTERIVIGGGLIASYVGQLAMGRAAVLLNANGNAVQLCPIANHPDEAGLLGAVHLAPSWMLVGHDAILAADIGGTNLRIGVVSMNPRKKSLKAGVAKLLHWRHADDRPSREQAVARLGSMCLELIDFAVTARLRLAPFIGIGCPGLIAENGVILAGGQNLPGDWEAEGFNITTEIARMLPSIDGHEPLVMLHNDAVVQGLSEVPRMTDVTRWGVLTIGTGLGNARFTNRTRQ